MPSLADLIGRPPTGEVHLMQGTVVGPPGVGYAAVHFGDAADVIGGIRYLAGASFSDGDTVWVLRLGGTLIILGKLSSSTDGNPELREGLELYHPSDTPYIDFHRAANPTEDAGADYNIRLINQTNDWLDLIGNLYATGWIKAANSAMRTWVPDTAYSEFSDGRRGVGVGDYSFLSGSDGNTFVNGKAGANVYLRINNADRFSVNADGSLHGSAGGASTVPECIGGTQIVNDGSGGNPNYIIQAGYAAPNFVGGNATLTFPQAFDRAVWAVLVAECGGAAGWMFGTTAHTVTNCGIYGMSHAGVAAGGPFGISYLAVGH